jgi:imidazolonepropionase-like amidohydrolase
MSLNRALGALLLPGAFAGLLWAQCDRSPLLIRNVSVWTGTALADGRDVLFRDGRVARVGRNLEAPPDARTIDGRGDTLLPGLIDLHLHFSIPGLPAGVRDFEVSGRQLLRYGVTAGRLHLASLEQAADLRRRGMEDCAAIPRIQAGGPGLGGGAPNVDGPVFAGVRSPEDARAKVERAADAGLQWVALHDILKFSAAERDALFAAAAARKLRVFSAAYTPEELRESLRRPVSTVDYIDRTDAPAYSDEMLRMLHSRRRTVAAVPTIGIFAWYAALRNGTASLDEPSLYEFLRPQDFEPVRARAKRDLSGNEYVASSVKFAPTLPRKLRDLIGTGVPVAIGTDVGSPAHLHPGAIWREMEAWRSYGVPHDQVLRAATNVPAAILEERDLGHLGPGARADFVLYRGRVTQGIFEANRVRAVGKGGALFVNEGRWVGP